MSYSKHGKLEKPRVLITDNINLQASVLLRDCAEVLYEPRLSHQELLDIIGDIDALMVRSTSQVSADVFQKGGRLKIVGRAGVGTDNIDIQQATKHGVIVINSPDGNTVAAAEHTIAMLMTLVRHIPEGDAQLKQGQWDRKNLVGIELYGKSIGIVGLGKIGRRVAKVCLSLGMKVNVFDPFLSKTVAEELGVQSVVLQDILERSDFITIHAPKTRETVDLFNETTFRQCKPGVRIINCARGGIINELALANAIREGLVAGAAIDVYNEEPVAADNPLLQMGQYANRLVLTPHLGASTEEAQINVALDVAEQIKAFFLQGHAKSAVNIPLLRQDILDPVKHYMPMAEVLGCFVRQMSQGAVSAVDITASGTLGQCRTEPLTLAILKGLFSLAQEGVNYVNAPSIAEENNIQVQEVSSTKSGNYLNLLQVRLTTETGVHTVSGTLLADSIFRIVEVDGYQMILQPTPYILITPHHDRPGMIAQVATILGKYQTNISALQVGRKGADAGGEATMVFNLDHPVSEEILKEIVSVEGIYGTLAVNL
jgi:D-3-phosphoglycerate dehydrogenase / 2-oxoglutarate reductase